MLAYPDSVDSQQPLLNSIQQTVTAYPVCEAWISLTSVISIALTDFDYNSLVSLSGVCDSMRKIFDYLQEIVIQEVTSISYLQSLSINAQSIGVNARVLSLSQSPGTAQMILNNNAINSQQILSAWDPAQQTFVPATPDAIGLQLVNGITFSGVDYS